MPPKSALRLPKGRTMYGRHFLFKTVPYAFVIFQVGRDMTMEKNANAKDAFINEFASY
jgi:hypothetical protein